MTGSTNVATPRPRPVVRETPTRLAVAADASAVAELNRRRNAPKRSATDAGTAAPRHIAAPTRSAAAGGAPCRREADRTRDARGETAGSADQRQPHPLVLYKDYTHLLAMDDRLTRAAIKVAIKLANLFNENKGYAWSGYTYLAAQLRIRKATVIAAVGQLEQLGYLDIERVGGRGRANEYRPVFATARQRLQELKEQAASAAVKGSISAPLSHGRRADKGSDFVPERVRSSEPHLPSSLPVGNYNSEGTGKALSGCEREGKREGEDVPAPIRPIASASRASRAMLRPATTTKAATAPRKAAPVTPRQRTALCERPAARPIMPRPLHNVPPSDGDDSLAALAFERMLHDLRRAAGDADCDYGFTVFEKTFPRQDADPKKLRSAWRRSVNAKNMENVLYRAFCWRLYHERLPDDYIPLPGRWLTEPTANGRRPLPPSCDHRTVEDIGSAIWYDGPPDEARAMLDDVEFYSPFQELLEGWPDNNPALAHKAFNGALARGATVDDILAGAHRVPLDARPPLGLWLKRRGWIDGTED